MKTHINKVADQIPQPKNKNTKKELDQIPGITKYEKFQFMRGMAYSEEQIRNYLSMTQEAFYMMDSRATSQVESYLRYLMKAGYIQNITNALTIQWKNVYALQERAIAAAKKATANEDDRKLVYAEAHIRNVLNDAIKTITELQEKTPAVTAFNQFVKENIIEGGGKKRIKGKLPVTPDELTN